MAKILKTTGEIISVEPKNGTDFSCEELNQIVGGHFEILNLKNGYMVVNKEGFRLKLPTNHLATVIYSYYLIKGNVLICGIEQIK